MKVCKKCGEISNDHSPICENSNCYGKTFEDYNEIKANAIKKLEQKDKLKKTICYSIILIYSILIIFLVGLKAINNDLSVGLVLETSILVITTILFLRFPGKVFLITHIFSLKDIDENQMSDMYDTYIKLLGLCSAIYSIIVLIKS